METEKNKMKVDWPITIISITCVFLFVIFMSVNPEYATDIISKIFSVTTSIIGPFLLWFILLGLLLCFYLAFSKYGKIKLGEGKPKYSLFSYVAMMMCAALASASMYYSIVEWAYYYAEPTFRIQPYSAEAAEYATAYTFFHWGFSVQVVFALTAVVVAYGVYIKKIPNIKISAVCESIMGDFRYKKAIGKVIDVICIFCTVGGLGVSLGLGVPLFANGITRITGIKESFGMDVVIILVISCLFSLSSYVGIEKGMRKMSDYTVYIAIAFITFVLFAGPTRFIIKQFTNSIGIMVTDYVRMSLWTDPVQANGFPEGWTMFLFAFALNYAAMMGVFITKISKGRTIREMILSCILGISVGSWLIFGINGGFAMNAQLTNQYDVADAVLNATGQKAIYDILDLLPGGILVPIFFLVLVLGFLATSLDSAAFSLSATTTRKPDASGNTSPLLRLLWCIVLAAIPLTIMFTGAPFRTLQTLCIFVSIPFVVIIIFMIIGLFKWFKQDTPA